jgi:hypothetical protein
MQYDAGPGEWSEREWKSPDKKQKPHAKRRRVALPPWALLAILIGIIILLCVGLVFIVRAIRGDQGTETATAEVEETSESLTTEAPVPVAPTLLVTPTSTAPLPISGTQVPPILTEIAPGATVVVQGTLGAGLNLRAEPNTNAGLVGNAKEGTELLVLEGPQEGAEFVWWKLRAPNGAEGWGAADWLVLKGE